MNHTYHGIHNHSNQVDYWNDWNHSTYTDHSNQVEACVVSTSDACLMWLSQQCPRGVDPSWSGSDFGTKEPFSLSNTTRQSPVHRPGNCLDLWSGAENDDIKSPKSWRL